MMNGCVILFTGKGCNKIKTPDMFCSEQLRFNDVFLSKPTLVKEKNYFGNWYGFFICLINYFFRLLLVDILLINGPYFVEVENQKFRN